MSFNEWDNKAVAWYKSLSLWTASAVAFGVGFFVGALLF